MRLETFKKFINLFLKRISRPL